MRRERAGGSVWRGRPVDAAVAVTYRCNARCVMCGIWRGPRTEECPPEVFGGLPWSLRWVNVTGGEPFLRSDLEEIVKRIRSACPRAHIIISTNGLLTDRIVEVMRRLDMGGRLGLAVSLDGIGEKHDEIRGVKDAFVSAQATMRRLAENGLGGVRIAFTITPGNVDHFARVYDLSRQLNVEFTCALAQGSEHYFQIDDEGLRTAPETLRAALEPVARAELRSFSPKRWARAYFLSGMLRFASGLGRPLPCRAGRDSFFVDPTGDVYLCNVLSCVMGNLNEQSFDEIWASERADRARGVAADCGDGCWMICSARTAMRRDKLRVLGWALWRKLQRGRAL